MKMPTTTQGTFKGTSTNKGTPKTPKIEKLNTHRVTIELSPNIPTVGGAYQTTVVGPRIPTVGGAYATTVVGPHIPTVGVVPIIGGQEGNPDRPFIIGSVYNATPSFSFNKIDPAGKASIVSVLQVGAQSSGAGAGKSAYNPFNITRTTDVASPSLFQAALSNDTYAPATLSFVRPNNPTPQTPRIEN